MKCFRLYFSWALVKILFRQRLQLTLLRPEYFLGSKVSTQKLITLCYHGLSMVNIDEANSSIISSKVTPLFGNHFYNELVKTIESAALSIYAVQYQWKWNIHERFSKIQMLGDAIRRARLRNVAVSVILNQESPRRHISVINRVTGDKLGEYGCLIKNYRASTLLHTKLWIIDCRYTFLGSHNVSTRSLTYNEEVSVKIDSIEVARLMKEYFDRLWG